MENNNISLQNIKVIFLREIKNYFNTPIGYIILFAFSLISNFFLFEIFKFWDRGISINTLFEIVRGAYVFFIPAITMRLWAEEKRSGTIEMLLTMPFSTSDLIIGKFLSALGFLSIVLLLTITIPLNVIMNATPDWWVIITGYIGMLMLGGAYIALGLFISWLTKDQIVAFLVSLLICLVVWLMGYQPVLKFLGPFKSIFAFLSISWHFDSLARGLLDTRDMIYFLSVTLLFLYFNKRSIQKWQGYNSEGK